MRWSVSCSRSVKVRLLEWVTTRSSTAPAQRQAARLAGEATDHLGAPAHLAARALQQVRAPEALAVLERIAQVHAERREVVGQTRGRRGEAPIGKSAHQPAQAPLAVALAGGLVERGPEAGAHFLLVRLGNVGEKVAQPMYGAALAVGLGPLRLDRVRESRARRRRRRSAGNAGRAPRGRGGAQSSPLRTRASQGRRRSEPACRLSRCSGAEHALLAAHGLDWQVDRVQEQRHHLDLGELALARRAVAVLELREQGLGSTPTRR
jgi:hypothetical protein